MTTLLLVLAGWAVLSLPLGIVVGSRLRDPYLGEPAYPLPMAPAVPAQGVGRPV